MLSFLVPSLPAFHVSSFHGAAFHGAAFYGAAPVTTSPRGVARLCTVATPESRNAELFSSLIAAEGVQASVDLGTSQTSRGRCLVATRDIEPGETVLVIPKSLLITAHRAGMIGGLQGQTDAMWDATGDLREEVGEQMFARGASWDVRLALGVFEACGGAGGPFWDGYRQLLPPPPRLAHPLTFPADWLAEVQDAALEAKVRAKAEKLRELYPSLHSHAVHPVTAGYESMGAPMELIPDRCSTHTPSWSACACTCRTCTCHHATGAPMELIPYPLQYTYALVVSRCFAMADGDTFAFVPFLDLCEMHMPICTCPYTHAHTCIGPHMHRPTHA